jgi:ATP-dependent helicase HrpA
VTVLGEAILLFDSLAEIRQRLTRAMAADRHRLRRQLRTVERAVRDDKPFDRSLARLNEQLERSIALRDRRSRDVPRLTFDPELPITGRIDEITAAIGQHPVTIVCGETGSGKSTQLPKICLGLGRGIDGLIGHTQPRRIAARSVAARIAEELDSPLGRHVGFKIRFTDATQPETYIKLMTDGILLAETQGDRFLDQYDTILIDEAHERSLNIDFLLGYLQRLLPRRPDLKLIITSATIDAARFSEHFTDPKTGAGAPIIEVSGRTFPVDVLYRPLQAEDQDSDDLDLQDAILQTVDELARTGPGDVLIFLPTERDILETHKTLRGHPIPGDGRQTEILPLYARLPARDQNKVFQPHTRRRIVLATNVAESSLTVPGIRFVIDTGTARISHYSPRRKVQRLPIEAVSRASADQRSGRCGRIGPGICVRLYSEVDYQTRDRYTLPEIRRTNLASVILQTKAMRLGELEDFPFLDPPRADAIRDGYKTLFELGALDQHRELTDLGRQLARLPVDPRIGRMILAAAQQRCLPEVLILAAVLEIQDPRERPHDKPQAADEAHARFADPASDFLAFLKLWDFYHQLRPKLTRSQLRKACRQNFLSFNRMREWLDIHRQLKQLADEAGLTTKQASQMRSEDQRYAAIHQALLAGLLSNVACRGDGYEYTGAGGIAFHLWPGSGIFAGKPKWIMAAELVETTRTYARTVARIAPEWIEPLAGHLVQRTYHEPHWSRRTGAAMAYERVTLFGMPIVPRRRVRYGTIDPIASRELLIRDGLVEGQCHVRAGFLNRNRRLVQELEQVATRSRRSDLYVGLQEQYDFYDQRIPAEVCDVAELEKWLRTVREQQPGVLEMKAEDLLGTSTADETWQQYPDRFSAGPASLPLVYRFEPGNDEDGITLTVPQAALNQVDAGRLGWLVPGLLEEKVLALIRSLPKPIRRNFVPAPETARKVVERLRFGDGSFLETVAAALQQMSDEPVSAADFRLDQVPHHLCMNVRVVDDQGQTIAVSRDVEHLQHQLRRQVAASFAEIREHAWHRDGLVRWDIEELPAEVTFHRDGLQLIGYPMLVDTGRDVALRLADSAPAAERSTREGLRRLICLAEHSKLRAQVAWLPGLDQWKLYAATLCSSRHLEQQLIELIADRAFLADEAVPRTATEFDEFRRRGVKRIGEAVQTITPLMRRLFESYHRAQLAIEQKDSPRWPEAMADMRSQRAGLIGEWFLVRTPYGWLEHYPRYFEAICVRLDRLSSGGLARDSQGLAALRPFLEAYRRRMQQLTKPVPYDAELEHFRWMLEEFRVSLFAQTLGTSLTVSAKRLEKQWAKVGAYGWAGNDREAAR